MERRDKLFARRQRTDRNNVCGTIRRTSGRHNLWPHLSPPQLGDALQIDTQPLKAVNREQAEAEAISVVKEKLSRLMSNYFQIRGKHK